jgi:putative transposase
MRPRSTRYAKYWCGYHFAEFTGVVLNDILRELECEPLAIEVMPDHVHVFVLCPPRHSPAYIVNHLKGKSARRILQRFPELRTRATREKLWRSYFVATAGNVTADIIKKYAEEQWEKGK